MLFVPAPPFLGRDTIAPTTAWAYSDTLTNNGPNTESHTFEGFAIGGADAGRVVVACIWWGFVLNATITAITIGGVAATHVQTNTDAGGTDRVAMYYAVVPTGTTADVAVTWSFATNLGVACSVYYGVPASSTPIDSGQHSAASGGVMTVSNLEIAAGGILIAAAAGSGGTPRSFGWTGSDAFIVDDEGTANQTVWSTSHVLTTEATSDDDLTCDPSGSATNTMVAGTWA